MYVGKKFKGAWTFGFEFRGQEVSGHYYNGTIFDDELTLFQQEVFHKCSVIERSGQDCFGTTVYERPETSIDAQWMQYF